jgi:hypothetical protein
MLADTRMGNSIQSVQSVQFLFIADIRARRLPLRLEQLDLAPILLEFLAVRILDFSEMTVYLVDGLLVQIDYEIEDVQRQLRIYARKQLTCLENDTTDIVEQLEMLEKKRVKLLEETSTLKSGLPESDETGDETLELVAKERLELLQKMAQAEEELRIEEKRAEQVERFSVFAVGLGSTQPQCLGQCVGSCACCIWSRLRSHVVFSQTSSNSMVALCFLEKYFRRSLLLPSNKDDLCCCKACNAFGN